MKGKNEQAEIKHKENLAYKDVLERGDYSILAIKSGYTYRTVVDIFNGHRRMTDRIKKALTSLLNDRKRNEDKLLEAAQVEPKCRKNPEIPASKCDNFCSQE